MIEIEQCGFLTTLQDAGRKGFLQFGVSKGGVMDVRSALLANLLIGNNADETVMEITQSPHRFHFLHETVIAFAGGGLQPQLNNKNIQLNQPVFIPAGSILECKQQIPGFRLYMAVAGGYKADVFLNSYSTDLLVKAGGHKGRVLKKKDILERKTGITGVLNNLFAVLKSGADVELNYVPSSFKTNMIRVIQGIEWNYLDQFSQTTFISAIYKVSPHSNRMGYRLTGDDLQTKQPCEMISSAVTQGTVQLTPSGELIVLMADAQTVGGYPRIAQVCAVDLPVLAQKRPGDEIQFQFITAEEAEELYLNEARQIQQLKQTLQELYAG